jgi:PleD family two-component response regulator
MNDYQSLRRSQGSQVEKTYELPDTAELPKLKNILILEDEAAFAALLKETLESEGYNVTTVSNGRRD